MASRYIEAECDAAHCEDGDCECEEYSVGDALRDIEMELDVVWKDRGPEDERFINSGWMRTQEEPWNSIATAFQKTRRNRLTR